MSLIRLDHDGPLAVLSIDSSPVTCSQPRI